jgi:hypothetical protein
MSCLELVDYLKNDDLRFITIHLLGRTHLGNEMANSVTI